MSKVNLWRDYFNIIIGSGLSPNLAVIIWLPLNPAETSWLHDKLAVCSWLSAVGCEQLSPS